MLVSSPLPVPWFFYFEKRVSVPWHFCRRATLVVWQAPQKRKKPRVKTTNNSPPQTSLSPLHLQASGNGGRGSGWERKKEGKARGVEATALVVTKARTLEERWGRGVRLVQWTLVRSWEWPEKGFHFHTDRPLLSEESTESWQKNYIMVCNNKKGQRQG